jgi:hypothetical protein
VRSSGPLPCALNGSVSWMYCLIGSDTEDTVGRSCFGSRPSELRFDSDASAPCASRKSTTAVLLRSYAKCSAVLRRMLWAWSHSTGGVRGPRVDVRHHRCT